MRLFSIVCPVYNTGPFLKRCVDSVLNQTYSNWELLLVDDGSTDESTKRLCDDYGLMDKRIRVFHTKNEGAFVSRRFGMKQSVGDFICYLDSDDYLDVRMMERVDSVIEKYDCDLVIFRYRRTGSLLNRKSKKLFRNETIFTQENNMVLKNLLCSGASLNNLWLKVVEREKAGVGMDFSQYSHIRNGEDKLQSIPIIFSAEKVVYITDVLYYYVKNPSSITKTKTTAEVLLQQMEQSRSIFDYLENSFKESGLTIPYDQLAVGAVHTCYIRMKRYIKGKKELDSEALSVIKFMQNEAFVKRYRQFVVRQELGIKERIWWEAYSQGKLLSYYQQFKRGGIISGLL